ncbi:MAG: hydroxymethylbilane synthase [Lachnospiraceae bacterium]|nr:hydroxymethylbilane synthase [Lachnospiraceae bacterium]
MEDNLIKIGTRGSALALAQTELVISAVQARYPDINIEKVIIKTRGDKEPDKPVSIFGDKRVFSAEIEEALSDGIIDMAVHSAKDLPSKLKEGLCVPCVLKREDEREVLVTLAKTSYEDLIKADMPVIGTGSLRRKMQLEHFFQNIELKDIRGNVETRINKLRNGGYSGIMLAAAGLKRLGLDREKDLGYKYFSTKDIVPAGGQGIIAVETRKEDASGGSLIEKVVKSINDKETFFHFNNERKIIEALGAGCNTGFGVISYCYIKDKEEKLHIRTIIKHHIFNGTGSREDAGRLIEMAIKHGKERY